MLGPSLSENNQTNKGAPLVLTSASTTRRTTADRFSLRAVKLLFHEHGSNIEPRIARRVSAFRSFSLRVKSRVNGSSQKDSDADSLGSNRRRNEKTGAGATPLIFRPLSGAEPLLRFS